MIIVQINCLTCAQIVSDNHKNLFKPIIELKNYCINCRVNIGKLQGIWLTILLIIISLFLKILFSSITDCIQSICNQLMFNDSLVNVTNNN